MAKTIWRLPDGDLTFSEECPEYGALEIKIPEGSELHWTAETGWVTKKTEPKQMVTVSITKQIGAHFNEALMFVCPSADRAKEIVNEGGHALNNEWDKIIVDGREWWVSKIASDPWAKYVISPVEYKE